MPDAIFLASTNAPVAFHEMAPWLALLVGLSLVGLAVIVLLRKHLLSEDSGRADSTGLLSDLRAMRDRGEISDDEYDRTRAVLIAKATGKDAEAVRIDAIRKAGGAVAQPGFDLTGRPLPASDRPSTPAPDNGEDA